jgi:hypothetical protein
MPTPVLLAPAVTASFAVFDPCPEHTVDAGGA